MRRSQKILGAARFLGERGVGGTVLHIRKSGVQVADLKTSPILNVFQYENIVYVL